MKLSGELTVEEIYASLARDAVDTWGAARSAEMEQALRGAAKNTWTLLQFPLSMFEDEPDSVADSWNSGER